MFLFCSWVQCVLALADVDEPQRALDLAKKHPKIRSQFKGASYSALTRTATKFAELGDKGGVRATVDLMTKDGLKPKPSFWRQLKEGGLGSATPFVRQQ